MSKILKTLINKVKYIISYDYFITKDKNKLEILL